MTEGNGQIVDIGLKAINESFEDAKYLEPAAKECAELMMMGAHRKLEINDAAAMQLYAMVTENHKVKVERTFDSGGGYVVRIETYEQLRDFFNGELGATTSESLEASNDS